jgi:hypothetical protein
MKRYADMIMFQSPAHPLDLNWLLWLDEEGALGPNSRLFAGRIGTDRGLVAAIQEAIEDAHMSLSDWSSLKGSTTEPLF